MQKQKFIRIAKRATSLAMRDSYIIKPYVKPAHYKHVKTALSALNFLLRYLDKGD